MAVCGSDKWCIGVMCMVFVNGSVKWCVGVICMCGCKW